MTDEEISEFLAREVMGWEWIGSGWLEHGKPLSKHHSDWDPLHKREQAFMLVDQLVRKGFEFDLTCWIDSEDQYHAADVFSKDVDYNALQDTLALAISLAAVKAMEGEDG